VPAVPEQFANLVAPTEKSETPAPTAGPGGGGELTPPGPAGAAVDSAPTESTVAPATPTTSATAAATSASDASAEDGAPAAPEQLTSEQSASNVAAEPKPAAAAPPPASAPASGSTASGAIPDVPSVPSADSTAQSDSAASADSAGPRVYGEGNVGSRITLRADADSWIQVRAADESLLLTRTLRPGDTYRVPNQPGLRLMTGNAGGLEIIVDGKPIPALGPVGAVKRNILLEPEQLKAGTAAAN
jgi:cytoskeleton protein RodZ